MANIYSRLTDEDVAEIESYLQERLAHVFVSFRVEPNDAIKNASTKGWEMSAVVHLASGLVVVQAISKHANSVNRASTAFHDLAELPNAPTRVAVVKDKAALGVGLNILSQAGRVIQSDQEDAVYKQAAARPN